MPGTAAEQHSVPLVCKLQCCHPVYSAAAVQQNFEGPISNVIPFYGIAPPPPSNSEIDQTGFRIVDLQGKVAKLAIMFELEIDCSINSHLG